MYDLKFENAQVCDGLGNPIFSGAVAVEAGRIAAIGDIPRKAKETVDAVGLVLAPGLVDVHTHYDAQITWDNTARPSPANGVTTVVIGNCGFTIAPCKVRDREVTLRNLTKVEGIPYQALEQGVAWNFESFGEYLSALESRGAVPNIACFAGHSSIRTFVMGEDARRRAATKEEIDSMCALLGEALDVGAIGLSTSMSQSHNGDGGFPVPSRLADDAEIEALAGVLRKKNKGTLQITRSNTASIESIGALQEIVARPLQMSAVMTTPGFPEMTEQDMRAIDAQRAAGREIWAHVSPFPEVMQFNLKKPFPLENLSAWKPAMEAADLKALRSVYKDTTFRQAVKNELKSLVPFRFNGQWEVVTVVRASREHLQQYNGRSLADIGAQTDRHPLDALLDIALEDDLETRFQAMTLNYDEERVRPLLDHPHSVISLGDAGAHVTFFCQAGTGLYLLQRYVRERHDMSLEQAIRLLTSRAADTHRIKDRGRVAVGAWADLFLFNPEMVGLGGNETVSDLPGGGSRIDRKPIGVHGVWVNGERVVDEQGLVPEPPRPGRVLREFDS